ncbi:MAG TPA: peptidoglycan-binding domain-containing protein [Xanthobacteraceae bacterium]|jgi:hypothetical protein
MVTREVKVVRSSREKRSAVRASDGESRWGAVLAALGWSHRDAVAVVVAVATVSAVVINALYMQVGPHPSPMFNMAAPMPATNSGIGTTAAVAGRARPAEPSSAKADSARASLRAPTEIVADIQRELARRGFFDGVVDGRRGPRIEAAIRNFELAAGMMPNPEPTEDLLAAIRRSSVRGPARTAVGAANSASAPRPPQPIRNDPIATMLGRH